jgi:hypothetical protein
MLAPRTFHRDEGAGHREMNSVEPGRKGFGGQQRATSRRRGRDYNFIAITRHDRLRWCATSARLSRLFLRVRQLLLHGVQLPLHGIDLPLQLFLVGAGRRDHQL